MEDHRRVALVTGANKGIGYEVASALGRLGYVTLLGARDPERGRGAVAKLVDDAGVDARFVHLDVTDPDTVGAAATEIDDEFGRLDVLVSNAAIKLEFHPAPPTTTTLDLVRQTYETNVFGTITVLQAMVPLVLRSSAGRIVMVSSGLGSAGMAADPASLYSRHPMLGYNTSKAAVNSISLQFANELRTTQVKVNVVDPGFTSTDMTGNQGRRTAARAAAVVVKYATLPDDGPTGGYFDERGAVAW